LASLWIGTQKKSQKQMEKYKRHHLKIIVFVCWCIGKSSVGPNNSHPAFFMVEFLVNMTTNYGWTITY